MAAVEDLAALAQAHEPVTRAALAIARGAEGRDLALIHQPADDLVECALVRNLKLLGIMRALLLGIATDRGARAAADLRNTQLERLFAHGLALARRDDHAGIRHRDADARDDLFKQLVAQAVVKHVRVDIVRPLDARHADRVRADAVHGFQMLGVHQQAGKLILVALEAEQHAETHIVDAALHCAVHRLGVIGIVVLGADRMQFEIALLVVGFLKQDIGADAGLLELAVILDRGRRDVDIDAADRAVFVLDAVNRLDALEDVFDRIVDRVLARFDCQTFVTQILQCDDLGAHLVLGQLFARNVLVLRVIRAVNAAVDAVVGQIERRKNHDAVAVKRQFDLLGQAVHLLHLFRDVAREQHGRFPVGQARAVHAGRGFLRPRLFEDAVDQRQVVLVFLRVADGLKDLLVVDELLGRERFGIIDRHCFSSSFLVGQMSLSFRCGLFSRLLRHLGR